MRQKIVDLLVAQPTMDIMAIVKNLHVEVAYKIMQHNGYSMSKTAKILGLNRTTLSMAIKKAKQDGFAPTPKDLSEEEFR